MARQVGAHGWSGGEVVLVVLAWGWTHVGGVVLADGKKARGMMMVVVMAVVRLPSASPSPNLLKGDHEFTTICQSSHQCEGQWEQVVEMGQASQAWRWQQQHDRRVWWQYGNAMEWCQKRVKRSQQQVQPQVAWVQQKVVWEQQTVAWGEQEEVCATWMVLLPQIRDP